MDEKIVGGLIVAALTGLSVIAYRHPGGYTKIFVALAAAMVMAGIGVTVWNAAVSITFDALFPLLPHEKFNDGMKTEQALQLGYWFVFIYSGAFAYLIFLGFLPKILGLDKK